MNWLRLSRPRSLRGWAMLGLILVMSPWFVLFGRWTVEFVRCGHQPIETSDFAAANSYTLPGDGTYTRFPLFSGFACSLDEVRGRSRSTLR